MNMRLDVRDVLPKIDLPTLILHRTGDTWIDVGHARYMAEHIPDATYVELPGADHRPWLGDVDAIADEIEVFLTGRKSRPRRRTSIGLEALSRREREVAALASRGETATEIASHLYLSKRTVESHLVSIYAKLGVQSKSELIRRSAFFAMNQLGVIVAGRATALVWVKATLTYLTPLVVSNVGVLSATRRGAAAVPSPMST